VLLSLQRCYRQFEVRARSERETRTATRLGKLFFLYCNSTASEGSEASIGTHRAHCSLVPRMAQPWWWLAYGPMRCTVGSVYGRLRIPLDKTEVCVMVDGIEPGAGLGEKDEVSV
jgi:hypothetical protein